MALEDVVGGFERYKDIAWVDETLQRDSSDPEAYEKFAKYMIKHRGMSQRLASRWMLSDDMNEKKTRRYAKIHASEDKSSLLDIVGQNYGGLIDEVSRENLKDLAVSLEDEDKNYLLIASALQSKKYDAVRRALANLYDISAWKEFIFTLGEKELANFANEYIQEQAERFVNERLSDKSERDGKKTYRLNPEKVRKYIRDTVDKYKTEEKDEEDEDIKDEWRDKWKDAYLRLADLYYRQEEEKD